MPHMISDDVKAFASKAMRYMWKQHVSHFESIKRLPHAGIDQFEKCNLAAVSAGDLLRAFIDESCGVVSIAPDFRGVQVPGGAIGALRRLPQVTEHVLENAIAPLLL